MLKLSDLLRFSRPESGDSPAVITESGGGIPMSEGARGEGPGEGDDLSPADLLRLFVAVCRALAFDELRMKPREKQFGLLLASESFGEGSASGVIDIEAWRLRMPVWRSNELKRMFENWRRAGWIVVDVTEKRFRLAPDQFPGWANVQAIQRSERQRHLSLMTEDDLHKTFAKISQVSAVRSAKISQEVTKFSQNAAIFSQLGEPKEGNVPETFNRSTSERINVKRCTEPPLATARSCENFAGVSHAGPSGVPMAEKIQALKEGVRQFVGESDWTAPEFWNCGTGWRHRVFVDEYSVVEGALAYCRSALTDKGSTIRIGKTKGAMLWSTIQRLRSEKLKEA
jgi:hypothetical protein